METQGEAALAVSPCRQKRLRLGPHFGEGRQGALHVGGGHREGLEARIGEPPRFPGSAPGDRGRKQIEAGAETQFCNTEPVAEPAGQGVAVQKDMPGFGKPVGQREIGVVKER